jgi:hypothetical protein
VAGGARSGPQSTAADQKGWFSGKPLPDLREKLADLCRLAAVDNPVMGKLAPKLEAQAAGTVGPSINARLVQRNAITVQQSLNRLLSPSRGATRFCSGGNR